MHGVLFELYHLEVADVCAVDDEADESAGGLLTVESGGSRVDMEDASLAVHQDFKDVGVTGDEELWGIVEDVAAHTAVVFAGITADVLHQDIDTFAREAQLFGIFASHDVAVYVAIYGTEGAWAVGCSTLHEHSLQSVGYVDSAHIAYMPHLVAVGEVCHIAIIPMRMGVGKQTYLFHFGGDGLYFRFSRIQSQCAFSVASLVQCSLIGVMSDCLGHVRRFHAA